MKETGPCMERTTKVVSLLTSCSWLSSPVTGLWCGTGCGWMMGVVDMIGGSRLSNTRTLRYPWLIRVSPSVIARPPRARSRTRSSWRTRASDVEPQTHNKNPQRQCRKFLHVADQNSFDCQLLGKNTRLFCLDVPTAPRVKS